MIFKNHIAVRLLRGDDDLPMEILVHHYPNLLKMKPDEITEDNPVAYQAKMLWELVRNRGQRAFYITSTVLDLLDKLHVKKSVVLPIRKEHSEEVIGTASTFDWSVFNGHLKPDAKYTFIFNELTNKSLLRIWVTPSDSAINFCRMWMTNTNIKEDYTYLKWCISFLDKRHNTLSNNWMEADVQEAEEFIYKVLCFFFLSENEELLIQPGGKHGTRKQGKVVNDLNVPITIVNSKWNITSIRTEGFPVSFHFRLQPYKTGSKMIPIQSYMKHGYVRRAKKPDSL